MRKHNEEFDDAIDDLITDVVEVAEKEREKSYINDDSDMFCLLDTLESFKENYIDKAWKAKRIDVIKRLHKRFKKNWM